MFDCLESRRYDPPYFGSLKCVMLKSWWMDGVFHNIIGNAWRENKYFFMGEGPDVSFLDWKEVREPGKESRERQELEEEKTGPKNSLIQGSARALGFCESCRAIGVEIIYYSLKRVMIL